MKIFKKKVNLSLTIALFLRQIVLTGNFDTTCGVNEPEKNRTKAIEYNKFYRKNTVMITKKRQK